MGGQPNDLPQTAKMALYIIPYYSCVACAAPSAYPDCSPAAPCLPLAVNIKVDREERPDVDKIYMTYVQVRRV